MFNSFAPKHLELEAGPFGTFTKVANIGTPKGFHRSIRFEQVAVAQNMVPKIWHLAIWKQ